MIANNAGLLEMSYIAWWKLYVL